RWPREVLPAALCKYLSRLARREARLVHQPATLVGASNSGVESPRLGSCACERRAQGVRATALEMEWRRTDRHAQVEYRRSALQLAGRSDRSGVESFPNLYFARRRFGGSEGTRSTRLYSRN